MLAQRLVPCFALAGLLAVAACDDPCAELARKVCRCERTDLLQQSCLERVDATEPDHTVRDAELECCSDRLDECTCARLDAGDLAACGVAQESDAAAPDACRIPDSR